MGPGLLAFMQAVQWEPKQGTARSQAPEVSSLVRYVGTRTGCSRL